MKIRILAVAIGAAALVLGVQVQAQTTVAENAATGGGIHRAGPGKGGRMMPQRGGQDRSAMTARRQGGGPSLAAFDVNADGMIDLDEFLAHHEDRPELALEHRDADGDGLLSREELAPRERPNRPDIDRAAVEECVQQEHPDFAGADGLEERFDTLDSNDDSYLDADELVAGRLAQAEAQFTALDADADGFLIQAELRAQRANRRELARSVRDCAREAARATTP